MRDHLAAFLRAWAEKDGRGYPDWAMRYLPVLRRLRRRCGLEERILEIGANECGFARFSGRRVIALDQSWDQLGAARAMQPVAGVAADAAALPFADASFGICVCLDVFEHLPESARLNAVTEILRVTHPSGVAVIGFPAGADATAAEAHIRAAYHAHTGRTLTWLEEHHACGLPDAAAMYDAVHDCAGGTRRISVEGNAALPVWEWIWKVLMCGWPGRGNAVFQVLLRMLVPVLSRMHATPCYRTLIWIEPFSRQTQKTEGS